MTHPTGQTDIAGYHVIKRLGQGGMGTVYLVDNPVLPRRDALKILSAELSRDDQFRSRFIREADVASRLTHPNIVSIYTRGETTGGQLWIAMEFVDGVDADAALRAGEMTPLRAVRITGEVAKALDYAHRHNVVHRDVKPANFLLTADGRDDERVLLGDFGIARALDDIGLTASGSVMATVAYAAPEVLGKADFDARADVYSLGCALYRLLTGSTPFAGAGGLAGIVTAHLTTPPPRVTERAPWLPAGLDAVIAKAMAKDPDLRFRTARELAAAAEEAFTRTTASGAEPPGHHVGHPPWWQHANDPATRPAPAFHPIPATSSESQRTPKVRIRWAAASAAAAILVVGGLVAIFALSGNHDGGATSRVSSTVPAISPSSATPPTRTAAPIVPAAMLLPADQLTAMMAPDPDSQESGMRVLVDQSTLFDDAKGIDTPECVSAWVPAQQTTYTGSGWNNAAVQTVRDPKKALWDIGVIQAVIAFPTPQAAAGYVDHQVPQWLACNDRAVTITPPNAASPPQTWTFSLAAKRNGVATIEYSQGPGRGTCQRALTAHQNVVVDVLACNSSPGIQNRAATIAETIADKAG